MSKENLEKAVGKEVTAEMLTTRGNTKINGILVDSEFPESITIQEGKAILKMSLFGTTGGIKNIVYDGKELYSNPMLNGKYPKGFSNEGQGFQRLMEFKRESLGENYRFQ